MTEPDLSVAQGDRLLAAIFGVAPICVPLDLAITAALTVGGESADRHCVCELTAAEIRRGRTYRVSFLWEVR